MEILLNARLDKDRYFFGRFSTENELKTNEGKVGVAGYSAKGFKCVTLFFAILFGKTLKLSDNGTVYYLNKSSFKKWARKYGETSVLDIANIKKTITKIMIRNDHFTPNELVNLFTPEDSEEFRTNILFRDDRIATLSQESIQDIFRKFEVERGMLLCRLFPSQRADLDFSTLNENMFQHLVADKCRRTQNNAFEIIESKVAKIQTLLPQQINRALELSSNQRWLEHLSEDQIPLVNINSLTQNGFDTLIDSFSANSPVRAQKLTDIQIQTSLNRFPESTLWLGKLSDPQISHVNFDSLSEDAFIALLGCLSCGHSYHAKRHKVQALTDQQVELAYRKFPRAIRLLSYPRNSPVEEHEFCFPEPSNV